jgi:hypothetical protein
VLLVLALLVLQVGLHMLVCSNRRFKRRRQLVDGIGIVRNVQLCWTPVAVSSVPVLAVLVAGAPVVAAMRCRQMR